MGTSTVKPHIRLDTKLVPLQAVWICSANGRLTSYGKTPCEAYRSWHARNYPYAGKALVSVYASQVATNSGHIIAGVLAFAIIVAGIISAVMLWDAA